MRIGPRTPSCRPRNRASNGQPTRPERIRTSALGPFVSKRWPESRPRQRQRPARGGWRQGSCSTLRSRWDQRRTAAVLRAAGPIILALSHRGSWAKAWSATLRRQRPGGSMHDLTRQPRILVIGGAGFLGSHIVDQLTETPAREIVVLDDFVRGTRANLEHGRPATRACRWSRAASRIVPLLRRADGGHRLRRSISPRCGSTSASTSRAARSKSTSSGPTTSSRRPSRQASRRSSTSSSASVYGDAVFTPMTEEHPFNNRTMYGATKIAGEQFFRAFYEQHKLRLRRPALHEHLRPADGLQGHLRQRDHEGARPRSTRGCRPSSSATAPRPTTSSTSPTSPGRTSWPCRQRRPTSSSTSASASRRRSGSWSTCSSRSRDRTSSPSTGRRSRCSSPTASAVPTRPSDCSASGQTIALEEGLRSVVEWRRQDQAGVSRGPPP